MEKAFEGVYTDGKKFFTKNLKPQKRVYGERLVNFNGEEYREWDAHRSKYCAGLKKGLNENIFFEGASVLYLGAAEGTTISHVSDIVGKKGLVIGVDISEISMIKLTKLAEERENIIPIVSDAQQTANYSDTIEELGGKVDAIFEDIAQRNQAEIFVKNACFLKKDGLGAISIKTKSISQSKAKEDILEEEKKILQKEFEILQTVSLEPYEKHHYLILLRKK